MYSIARKYFVLYNHLFVPGIGNFAVITNPAETDIAERCIIPSKKNIVFSNDKLSQDEEFYSFLSKELNVSASDATNNFEDFALQLKQRLNENSTVHLEGIGTLKKNTANTITFQPEELPEYFPVISAEKIIRKNAIHTVRVGEQEKTSVEMHTALQQPVALKKERWWIAAAILAFIGIAIIILYYTTH